jgi:crotonobetainyl-CoA:carnitine CoA-transferase CaiB-like acyl-CoA transferase
LDGVLVVSLEQAVAAPFTTRQLADLGARVIKVERHDGDFARHYDRSVLGQSSYFVWLNRSKESVVLDLKTDRGREALGRLLDRADVFVQNLAPGAVDRLGFAPQQLRAARPELVTCSISGYGEGGPSQQRKAYDALVQCETGLVSITGTAEQPVKVGISVADIAAGMYGYAGVLSALYRRERTGLGAHLAVSLFDALGEWMSQPALWTRYSGTEPRRTGPHHASIAPYGPFPTADGGHVQLAVQNEREWQRFVEQVLHRPELLADERFRGNASRIEHREQLDALVTAALSALPAEEVLRRLDAAGIANARLNTMHEFTEHVQLTARNRWTATPTPAGEVETLVPPVTSAELGVRIRPVPAAGQHTQAVLAELGFGPDEIEDMTAEGAA